ncbi:hypothetical protein ACHAWF_018902 [Thalassiosira exigua]
MASILAKGTYEQDVSRMADENSNTTSAMSTCDAESPCGHVPVPGQVLQSSKKYHYDCEADPRQNDRSKQLKWCSCSRPHMRAFYCCNWGFFFACLIWFAINPLLPEIRTSLSLETSTIWTSSILSLSGTILMRLALGPLCDIIGPRTMFPIVLCFASIPTACIGLINTATGLFIVRTLVGLAGAVFVLCQVWMSAMFANETKGTAISIVAGWGNFASGLTQLMVGSALLPAFKILFDGDAERAWRMVPIVPAVMASIAGIVIVMISDDTPRGNYHELRQQGQPETHRQFPRLGALKRSTWFLCVQNACATGVELTLHNASVLYFQDEFDQTTESSAAIASILGWMGLACGIGGYLSDKANERIGFRGRLCIQAVILLCEGSLIIIFSRMKSFGGAIVTMTVLSLFIQVSEGTTYSIAPFVDVAEGTVSGIVSAAGNLGAILWGLTFRQLSYGRAFMVMGATAMASAFLSPLIIPNIEVGNDERESVGSTYQSSKVPNIEVGNDERESIGSTYQSSKVPNIEVGNDECESVGSTYQSSKSSKKSVQRVEVSRSALLANADFFRRRCSDSHLMAVVKSNAYGHGIPEVVSVLSGVVDWFGVNSFEEAARVRCLDSETPILVMGMNACHFEEQAIAPLQNLTFVISSIRAIERLRASAPDSDFHVKLDTGLSRLGYRQGDEMNALLSYLGHHPDLPWTGIMTHFANVDDETYTLNQLGQFLTFRSQAQEFAKRPLMAHAAASSAALTIPESRLDMVRVGIGLYGLWPSHEVEQSIKSRSEPGLKPVMQWVSCIVHCHWIPAGSFVGYDCTLQVNHPTRIGVVPIGYFEGYCRALSNRSSVLICGRRCNVVGPVSMNMMNVDITSVPQACEGDRVVLIGKSGEEVISVEDLAQIMGTIPYEVVSRVKESLPRVIVD